MATRFLRYDSDPILRKKCKAVLKVDDKIRQLLDDMIYCNYDTQDVVDITLDDLQVGDEIILTIRSSEIENLQKEDDNKAKIAVEQLQLGTQRIK